jgi:UDP-glucose 4-epimerase
VIRTARRVTGREIPFEVEPARPGDPSRLVADASRAKSVLGWEPEYPLLESIIETAWNWHRAHPNGYEQTRN